MHRHGLGGSRGRRTLGSGLHGNCWRGSTRPRPRGYGAPACYARRPPNAGHRSNPLNGFDTGPAGCRRPVRRGSCARIPPSPGPVVLPSLCCRRWKPSVPNHRHPHPLFIGIRCATEHGGRMRSPTTMGGWCIKTPPCAVAAKRVSASDQVRPWSSEIRRRTSEVSWFPAFWAVQSNHSSSPWVKRIGFCSDRLESKDSCRGSDHSRAQPPAGSCSKAEK